jgi:hypothetical protein
MKKNKFLLVTLWFLILLTNIKAQEVILSKNAVFFEILGNGGLYSINYERCLSENLIGRIGFSSFLSVDVIGGETGGRITTIPILITYFSGKKKSHFEIGGGMLFGKDNEDQVAGTIIDLTSFIGYRYQAPGKGILFRIGLTPFLSLDNKANYPDKGLSLSGGISLGYHF